MTEISKTLSESKICSMCRLLKSKHTQEELLACSKKLQEFKMNLTGGAGIK